MKGATVLAGAALLLVAGCGQSATDKAAARLTAASDQLALEENYGEILKDVDHRPAMLSTHLRRFDLSARALAVDVGKDKVRRLLAADATAIASVCTECAAAFDRTRSTL